MPEDRSPDSERRLRRQVRRLKELRAADTEESTGLKADVEALVGALHQSTVENCVLRQQLADGGVVVRSLPQLRTGDTSHPVPSDFLCASGMRS